MKIILDLDGVVTDFRYSLLEYMGLLDYYDKTSIWDFQQQLPCREEEFRQAWKNFTAENKWVDMALVKGALKGVNTLRRWGHDVVFLTSRKSNEKGQTYQWMLKHDFALIPIRFWVNKHVYLKHAKPDLFVDDDPKQILAARELGIHTVVFDQPCNRELADPRADGWGRLLLYIRNMEREEAESGRN